MKSQLQVLREQKRKDNSAVAVNIAFDRLRGELARFEFACRKNNSPIRSVTYRVLDDGNIKTHVVYRKKK